MSDQKPIEPITIGSGVYKIGRLDIFDQMVIARRMMPALKGVITPELLGAVMAARDTEGKIDLKNLDIGTMIPALADAFYSLTDEDAQRIVRTAMKVVHRQNAQGIYSALMTPQGVFMFDDVKMGDALQLAWKVIEAHLGDFFSTAP